MSSEISAAFTGNLAFHVNSEKSGVYVTSLGLIGRRSTSMISRVLEVKLPLLVSICGAQS